MRRTGWLIGGAALVLLAGSGWLMAAEQARSQAASAMELLEASLPPGSEGKLRRAPHQPGGHHPDQPSPASGSARKGDPGP